jgi:hypothetical protein
MLRNKSELQELPEGVYGKLLFNMRINTGKRMSKTGYHILVTEEDCERVHIYLVRDTNKPKNRYVTHDRAFIDVTDHTSLYVAMTAHVNGMLHKIPEERRFLHYHEVLQFGTHPNTVIDVALNSSFNEETRYPFPQGNISGYPFQVQNMPSRSRKDEIRGYKPATVVRLSKEEWLRQHYPEITELPKWRFPNMAVA